MTHKWPISSFVQRLDHFNGPSIHSESPAESCSPPRSIQVMPWISIDLSESVLLKIQLALAHTVIAASPQYESERGGAIAARSAEALARLACPACILSSSGMPPRPWLYYVLSFTPNCRYAARVPLVLLPCHSQVFR